MLGGTAMKFFIFRRRSFLSVLVLCALLLVGGIYAVLTAPNRAEPTISWVIAEKTIVVDPGHGGTFPGRVNEDNILEKDINLQIATRLEAYLAESGANSMMTRRSDIDLVPTDSQSEKLIVQQRSDLEARIQLTKESKADYMISIHCNSIPNEKWYGAQTFYNPNDVESKALAKAIQQSLNQHIEDNDREALPREDTYLFEHAVATTVIVECGFLSNQAEAARLQDSAYQDALAWAIYLGMQDYFKK